VNLRWGAKRIALVVAALAVAIYLAILLLVTPGVGHAQTATKSAGCTNGQASWGVPLNAFGITVKKTAFWGRMNQQGCVNKKGAVVLGTPAVYQGVGGFASSIGWRFDGIMAGGQKYLTPDHRVARTKRILQFSQCVSQPFGCTVIRTYKMKLFLWWSAGPGPIISVHQ
jgi:hypothetical protein